MRSRRYRIRFPSDNLSRLDQGKAWFRVATEDGEERIEFHDYAAIYKHPGLYEQLFYDRLKCNSPRKLSDLLHAVVLGDGGDPTRLRVLDVGAGNGMVGELLVGQGVARVVGVDIIAEAGEACWRDRPGAYDAYYVADLTRLEPEMEADLREWRFDAMTVVAALGFGDIPVPAFAAAWNLISADGWVAFNIKESFLDSTDTSGFSRLIKRLIHNDYLKLHHLDRYRHRLSVEGHQLHYYAVIGHKRREIDDACLAGI